MTFSILPHLQPPNFIPQFPPKIPNNYAKDAVSRNIRKKSLLIKKSGAPLLLSIHLVTKYKHQAIITKHPTP